MKKFAIPFILLFLSIFIIFINFPIIPKYLAFDEIEFTKLALSLENKSYTPYSTLATGHSTLYFYIILLSLKILGINVLALRLPAAIFGVLSVVMFYLIIKKISKQFNNLTIGQSLPFLLTFVFLSSRWFINFSRFAFETTFLLFLELTALYFFISFFSNKKNYYLILTGLFTGLSYLSYTPGRIFFLLPLSLLIIEIFKRKKQQFNHLAIKHILLFLIPFIIIISPLTFYLSTHTDSRIDQLFFWRNHEMTVNEKINGTLENIKSISLMFFTSGDMNGKHNYPGKPALNPIIFGLMIIGLYSAIKDYKKTINQIFLIYFTLSVFPSLAIYPWENPSMLRTFTAIPPIVYFVGLSIGNLSMITQRSLLKNKQWFISLVSLLILISSFYEIRTYFKYQAPVFEHSFEIRYPLDEAVKMKNVYEKIN